MPAHPARDPALAQLSWRSPATGDDARARRSNHWLVTEHYDVIIVGSGAVDRMAVHVVLAAVSIITAG
jgi:hypothetical protein